MVGRNLGHRIRRIGPIRKHGAQSVSSWTREILIGMLEFQFILKSNRGLDASNPTSCLDVGYECSVTEVILCLLLYTPLAVLGVVVFGLLILRDFDEFYEIVVDVLETFLHFLGCWDRVLRICIKVDVELWIIIPVGIKL